MLNYRFSETEENGKSFVEELMELLPYNSPDTVGLLLKILEAVSKEVTVYPEKYLVIMEEFKDIEATDKVLELDCY